jgi:hypothetical protein
MFEPKWGFHPRGLNAVAVALVYVTCRGRSASLPAEPSAERRPGLYDAIKTDDQIETRFVDHAGQGLHATTKAKHGRVQSLELRVSDAIGRTDTSTTDGVDFVGARVRDGITLETVPLCDSLGPAKGLRFPIAATVTPARALVDSSRRFRRVGRCQVLGVDPSRTNSGRWQAPAVLRNRRKSRSPRAGDRTAASTPSRRAMAPLDLQDRLRVIDADPASLSHERMKRVLVLQLFLLSLRVGFRAPLNPRTCQGDELFGGRISRRTNCW